MEFNNLGLILPDAVSYTEINNKTIMVRSYLPVNEKLDLISWVINQSADDLKFYNVGKIDIFLTLGIIKYYTDIQFSDENIQNATATYDLIITNEVYENIKFIIPDTELDWIRTTLFETIDSIYKYQNSIMGILDTVTTDYQNLNFDVEQLQKNISNPDNLTLLKDVVTKLG